MPNMKDLDHKGKLRCPVCYGRGKYRIPLGKGRGFKWYVCDECDGSGYVDVDVYEPDTAQGDEAEADPRSDW